MYPFRNFFKPFSHEFHHFSSFSSLAHKSSSKWSVGLFTLSIGSAFIFYLSPREGEIKKHINKIKSFICFPIYLCQEKIVDFKKEINKSQFSDIVHWIPPSRSELLSTLKNTKEFDLIIIGGGATGTGCALEAATRGLKVVCLERDDFSSGKHLFFFLQYILNCFC